MYHIGALRDHNTGPFVGSIMTSFNYKNYQSNDRNYWKDFLIDTDVIFSPNAYKLDEFFMDVTRQERDINTLSVWMPPVVEKSFQFSTINKNPLQQIYVWYNDDDKGHDPFYPYFEDLSLTSYKNQIIFSRTNEPNFHEYFATIISNHLIKQWKPDILHAFASGTLVLIEEKMSAMLQELGYVEKIHYVSYSAQHPNIAIDFVLNPKNHNALNKIRLNGFYHTKQGNHTVEHRASIINNYVEKNQVEYTLTEYNGFEDFACPSVMYENMEECMKVVNQYAFCQFNATA